MKSNLNCIDFVTTCHNIIRVSHHVPQNVSALCISNNIMSRSEQDTNKIILVTLDNECMKMYHNMLCYFDDLYILENSNHKCFSS